MAATQIELYDLKKITNHFSDALKIACGSYGEVYKADYKGEEIAVKLIDSTKEIDNELFMNELNNHMKLQHPNIVRLVGYCNEVTRNYVGQKDGTHVFGKKLYKVLCFEYMHGRSLDMCFSANSLGDNWQTHYQIIKGTCEGLCYLHHGCEHRILHLDLKPANILLDKGMNPKIADFGSSRIYTDSRSHREEVHSYSGTMKYMAPELRNDGALTEQADVFSLGVTIMDIIGGSVGFELYRELDVKKFVEYICAYWRERDSTSDIYQVEACIKIAIGCVDPYYMNRPTVKDIVADLNNIEKQILDKIELSELLRITNQFSEVQKVGSGDFGDVYKAVYNGEEIAVKLLDAPKGIDDGQFMDVLSNHMHTQHPNIVRLVGYCSEEMKKYVEQNDRPVFGKHIYRVLCFEYMHGKSLDRRLSENSLGDKWYTHYKIIKGTCEGLSYLHNESGSQILHMDLKPANILLDMHMKPKIADFGLSKICSPSRRHVKVDSLPAITKYMAPELRCGSDMSEKTDVFSLGVTIMDIIRGSDGFQLYHDLGDTKFVEDACTYWSERDRKAHLYQVERCTKIAIRCVDPKRKNRPTINEIVADLNDMYKETVGLPSYSYNMHIDRLRMAMQIESSELRRITNNYSEIQKVRSSGYADVYKAVYNREEIAVKLLDPTKGINDQQFTNIVSNHMMVEHPNIVRLVGYCNKVSRKYVEQKDGQHVFGNKIYKVLCFEYMRGRSLEKRLSENSLGDDWNTHYQIIKGTCEGLCYLHDGCEPAVLHTDLKPANILLDSHMKPKIVDFGLSRIDQFSGTMKYMAPEFKHGNNMSKMADVYSLGVTIIGVIKGSNCLELYDGRFSEGGFYDDLEASKTVKDARTYWRRRDMAANLYQVETCIKIAIRCVDNERKMRPTTKEIMASLNEMETSKGLHIPHKISGASSGRGPLDVVIVYAFDCADSNPPWYMDNGIFSLVHEKLTHFNDSCIGYIMLTPNTNMSNTILVSDMILVDSAETKETGYTGFAKHGMTYTENMAAGLVEAHKMISNRDHRSGIILFFSNGLVNLEDFFDGTDNNFISKVPVHTFTLTADADDHVLHSIAANSPGGKFHSTPVPDRPSLSAPFSKLLDSLLDEADLNVASKPLVLKLELLKSITSDFSTTLELGRGGFGVVYKGVFSSGENVAVKKLESHLVKDETFQSEVSCLAGFKHPNVVQIVGYCAESSWEMVPQPIGRSIWAEFPKRLICLEYVCNGGLNNYISDNSMGLEWSTRFDIIKGICSGLDFLHEECHIVHLDLKPENILMDAAMKPKIADFGLSRIFQDHESRFVTKICAGTLGYMAPEYIIEGLITTKADIFSLGVIIIQIVTGHKKYPLSAHFRSASGNDCPQSSDTSSHDFVQKVLRHWRAKFMSMPNHKSIEKYSQQVKQCITIALKCVNHYKEKRPTAKDIIQVLTAVDQEDLSKKHLSDSECRPSELSGGNEDI